MQPSKSKSESFFKNATNSIVKKIKNKKTDKAALSSKNASTDNTKDDVNGIKYDTEEEDGAIYEEVKSFNKENMYENVPTDGNNHEHKPYYTNETQPTNNDQQLKIGETTMEKNSITQPKKETEALSVTTEKEETETIGKATEPVNNKLNDIQNNPSDPGGQNLPDKPLLSTKAQEDSTTPNKDTPATPLEETTNKKILTPGEGKTTEPVDKQLLPEKDPATPNENVPKNENEDGKLSAATGEETVNTPATPPERKKQQIEEELTESVTLTPGEEQMKEPVDELPLPEEIRKDHTTLNDENVPKKENEDGKLSAATGGGAVNGTAMPPEEKTNKKILTPGEEKTTEPAGEKPLTEEDHTTLNKDAHDGKKDNELPTATGGGAVNGTAMPPEEKTNKKILTPGEEKATEPAGEKPLPEEDSITLNKDAHDGKKDNELPTATGGGAVSGTAMPPEEKTLIPGTPSGNNNAGRDKDLSANKNNQAVIKKKHVQRGLGLTGVGLASGALATGLYFLIEKVIKPMTNKNGKFGAIAGVATAILVTIILLTFATIKIIEKTKVPSSSKKPTPPSTPSTSTSTPSTDTANASPSSCCSAAEKSKKNRY